MSRMPTFICFVAALALCSCATTDEETLPERSLGCVEQLQEFQDRQFEFEHELIEQGYPQGIVTGMAASPKHNVIFLFQYSHEVETSPTRKHGFWFSKDNGLNWDLRTFPGTSITSILIDDVDDTIYIATRDGYIFQSRDMANTWLPFSNGLLYIDHETFAARVTRLTIDHERGRLFALVQTDIGSIYSTSIEKANWEGIASGLPDYFTAVDACYSPSERLIYTINGNSGYIPIVPRDLSKSGLYHGVETSNGYRWNMEPGLPSHELLDAAVARVEIEPGTGIPYASTAAGLYRKVGAEWIQELPEPFIQSLQFEVATDKTNNSPRAVSISLDRLFLRENGTWRRVQGTPWNSDARVASILFFAGTIFAGTNDGFWVTRDTGETWDRLIIETAEQNPAAQE